MYAAYGRLQAIGRDPYEITPAEVFRGQFDPVLRWTERPWVDTPSVYGPITSWSQLLANKLGGENMHDIVFWLQVSAVVPFLIACAGIVALAHGDRRRQARAALLTIANPVLIWAVVAGAHNEAMSVMFAVAGMFFMRKNPLLAGLGIGLAGCAKLSIGIWGIAMLWAYRREPKKALLLCLGAGIPMVLAYVVWQPTAFFQVLRNGSYVSVGSWANPVYRFFDVFMTSVNAKIVTGVISYLGLFVIGWMLSRVVPWTPAPGLPRGADPQRDPLTIALRSALVMSVAWLITAMYTLSWYDLIAWMPLALLAANKLDTHHGAAGGAVVAGLRARPGAGRDQHRSGPGLHGQPDPGHRFARHPVRRPAGGRPVVAPPGSSGAVPAGARRPKVLGRSRDTVDLLSKSDDEGRWPYALTEIGRSMWAPGWQTPVEREAAPRSELAIKVALAVTAPGVDVSGRAAASTDGDAPAPARAHRKQASVGAEADLAQALVLDHLIFAAEAESRWLDHIEVKMKVSGPAGEPSPPSVDRAPRTVRLRSRWHRRPSNGRAPDER